MQPLLLEGCTVHCCTDYMKSSWFKKGSGLNVMLQILVDKAQSVHIHILYSHNYV